MTSIKPRLNRTHKGLREDYHLIIQVIRHRQKREIDTPYRLYGDELDKETGLMVYRKCHSRYPETIAEVNRHIACIVAELETLAGALYAEKGECFTAADLSEAYRRRSDLSQMFVYADAQIGRLQSEGRDGTATNYANGFRALEAYLGHRNLALSEFTSDLVDSFVKHLEGKKNLPNTIVFYLKQLRVVYNRALKEHVVREDLHPFRNQKMKEEKTRKIAVSAKEVRCIASAGLSHLHPDFELARSVFMFSFYTRGMAFVDMCHLTKDNIQGDYLCYRRRKTKQMLRIRIEKPLRELIKRYSAPGSEYLLPMLRQDDSRKARLNVQNRLNKRIRELGVSLGLASPLRFYVARHTWATLARNAGVGLSVISCGMGHMSEKTTRVYLADMDVRQLDRANATVMKLLI